MGYLYKSSFDPSNPMKNLIAFDDNGGIETQFRIQVSLQSRSTCILVVTTHHPSQIGIFWMSASGPDRVVFTPMAQISGELA